MPEITLEELSRRVDQLFQLVSPQNKVRPEIKGRPLGSAVWRDCALSALDQYNNIASLEELTRSIAPRFAQLPRAIVKKRIKTALFHLRDHGFVEIQPLAQRGDFEITRIIRVRDLNERPLGYYLNASRKA